ncbi:hypothetical protein BDN70DRAFT_926842 [Pholiota conissans]|uniref:F-box domain-containing protein n=1 Tax=Pholiota conissans TaxID=109636 RepID=A0A9P5ZEV4_9AGAR|nr:hypothetical protein BDN70DRAFT_926842 [Pholiota conissans]
MHSTNSHHQGMENDDEETPAIDLERSNSCSDIGRLLPFYQLDGHDLLDNLWGRRQREWSIRSKNLSKGRDRGNYVRSYVLSKLRIEMKSIRPRVSWSLEALWSLPAELICSIFEFLHPIDLYHAIRASKKLRHFLLDKNTESIWKQAFHNYPDIPLYPNYVSAPKWVSLAFGPATCDVYLSTN